jgi:23S rRNA pseudouridine2605 synthase
MEERIQKIIANSGHCSRRKAEELIKSNLVKLNNNIVKLGDKADPKKDKITVNNKQITTTEKKHYYILNKPKGILVTKQDPGRRKTIYGLGAMRKLKLKLKKSLNYVGRLDALSEGLLILTDDGELTNQLTHPKHHAKKTYRLRVEPVLSKSDILRIEAGITIDNRKTIAKISKQKKNEFSLEISEGRNRIIRRILEETLNYKIYQLKRIQIENIDLGNLETGQTRELTGEEVQELKSSLE